MRAVFRYASHGSPRRSSRPKILDPSLSNEVALKFVQRLSIHTIYFHHSAHSPVRFSSAFLYMAHVISKAVSLYQGAFVGAVRAPLAFHVAVVVDIATNRASTR